MTLAKAKTKTIETFIVHELLMIVTYNRQNMFIVQATEEAEVEHGRELRRLADFQRDAVSRRSRSNSYGSVRQRVLSRHRLGANVTDPSLLRQRPYF
jgi:hypothetical protein